MGSNIVDISQRPHEVAHSALMDAVQKWRAFGATDREVGELLLANAVTFLWDGDNSDALMKVVQDTAQAHVNSFLYSIGKRRAPE